MKTTLFFAMFLAVTGVVHSDGRVAPPGEFAGVFVESYEEKIFFPCETEWASSGWSLRFPPGVSAPLPRYEEKGPGFPTLAHYVRLRGTLSKPGSYGNGFQSRELTVDTVLEVRDTSVVHCRSEFDRRPVRWEGAGAVHGMPAFAATTDDRTLVAVADNSGLVSVWREGLRIGQYRYSKPPPPGSVPTTTIAFSPSNRLIAVGTGDGWVRIWSISNGRLLRELDHSAHTDTIGSPGEVGYGVFVGVWPVTGLAFTSDDSTLITSGGARAYAWSMKTGQKIGEFVGAGKHRATEPSQIAILRHPDRVVALGRDGTIRLYSPRGGAPEFVANAPIVDLMLGQLTASPDEKLLAIRVKQDSVAIWSLETGTIIHNLRIPSFHHGGLAFSPDSKLIAISGGATAVYLWETESGKPFTRLLAPYSGARNLWFTEKGDSIVMSSLWDSTLSVVRVRYQFDPRFILH